VKEPKAGPWSIASAPGADALVEESQGPSPNWSQTRVRISRV
jgi:hypothetical protein